MTPGRQEIFGAVLTAFLSFAVAPNAHAATLIGASVAGEFHYPTLGTIISSGGPVIVGAGEEFLLGAHSVDVSASQVVVTYVGSHDAPFAPAAFNGFVLNFTGGPSIVGALVNSASTLLPVSVVVFPSVIEMNFQGVSNVYGYKAIIDLTLVDAAAVPIPGALPLFASGVAGIGFLLHRRRRTRKQIETPQAG